VHEQVSEKGPGTPAGLDAAANRLSAEAVDRSGARAHKSYLYRAVDAIASCLVTDASRRAEVDEYATGLLKAIGLFVRGRAGLAGTALAHALDAMDPDSSAATGSRWRSG
jgi:hypothetical protein